MPTEMFNEAGEETKDRSYPDVEDLIFFFLLFLRETTNFIIVIAPGFFKGFLQEMGLCPKAAAVSYPYAHFFPIMPLTVLMPIFFFSH